MTPRIVDGLHYHLPFYRAVRAGKNDALAAVLKATEHMQGAGYEFTSIFSERMADGWAVTINLEGARD